MSLQEQVGSSWGHLEDTEIYGRPIDAEESVIIDKKNRDPELKVTYEASHALIYAKNKKKAFGLYDQKASILMQVRFDGYIGFPGGLIDPGESCEAALKREMFEEMYLNPQKHSICSEHHIVSHYNKKTGLVTHFYALEIPMSELEMIEIDALKAKDYGNEVWGTIRVPLYTMGDGYRGFPAFLNNQFAGNAKEQLLITIKKLGLMSNDDIQKAITAKPVKI